MPSFPVSPDLKQLIDWCNQPARPFAGDTHGLLFFMFLNDFAPLLPKGLVYQGFLFFRPPPVGTSPRRHSGNFEGTGRLAPTVELCEHKSSLGRDKVPSWVRIVMGLPPASIVGLVSFFRGEVPGGPEDLGEKLQSPPRTMLTQFESDIVVDGLTFGDQPTDFPGEPVAITVGPAHFELRKTSLIL